MTEWNEKSISNEEADQFIELLLEDIDFLDNFDNETIEPLNEFTSYPDQHHIIAVTSKRRRYNRTQNNHTPIMPPQRYQHIVIPRIVKNDIRRKYLLMYENVMNSYDYQLINSFFHQFMVHDVEFEKKYDKRNNFPPAKLLCGVTALVEHVLLLLQVSPDMVTRTSEIQLKQSSRDLQRAEITCRLTCHHSNLYEAHPNEFTKLINDDPVLGPLRSKGGYDRNLSVLRKRKSHDSLHQTLFDPLNGTFLPSRFRRIENPIQCVCGGYLSLVVNQDKRIERLMVSQFHVQHLGGM